MLRVMIPMNERKMRLYAHEFDDKIAKGDVRSKTPEAMNERVQKIAKGDVRRTPKAVNGRAQGDAGILTRIVLLQYAGPITCSGLMTQSQLCGEDN